MAIPDYQSLMLPLLKFLNDGQERNVREAIDSLSAEFKLSEQEKQELLPSGQQPIIDNRIGWARTYILKAGLIESPRRGFIKITEKGKEVLSKKPTKINVKFLEQFPEFIEFRTIKKEQGEEKSKSLAEIDKEVENITPDELMENGFNSIQASLGQEILAKIRKSPPAFFENVVLKLLSNMGYGKGNVTGQSGDGGIDGYIYQDKLGLDKILFQAKRFSEDAPVSASMIRDFIGTLATNNANKGVFITTSRFPKDAENLSSRSQKPIRLIDAPRLVKLMIEFNIGISIDKVYEVKKIDSDFFPEE